MKQAIPNILSIAGSDPSGGAGIQADLKTFSALGCYGMAAITALTAQNTQGVRGVVNVPPAFMKDQLEAIFEDVNVAAVKIGMLGNADIASVVADILERFEPSHIVLDPVMLATSGDALISADAVDVMKARLVPLVSVVTPNIPEAEKLMRAAVLDLETAAENLRERLGARAVYLKGGHLKSDLATDVLATAAGTKIYEAPRVDTLNMHGTGCTLSSAIAAYLAHGLPLEEACGKAKNYLTGALKHAEVLNVGTGHGPVYHGWAGLERI